MLQPVQGLVGFVEARHSERCGVERGGEDCSTRWVHVCPSGINQTLNGVQRVLGCNIQTGHDRRDAKSRFIMGNWAPEAPRECFESGRPGGLLWHNPVEPVSHRGFVVPEVEASLSTDAVHGSRELPVLEVAFVQESRQVLVRLAFRHVDHSPRTQAFKSFKLR